MLIDYLGRFAYLKKYALKVVIVMAAVLSINGLIETLTHYNIILNLAITTGLYPSDTLIITEIRYGLKRAQSAFGMHTSWGGYAFIVCCFLLYLKILQYNFQVCKLSHYSARNEYILYRSKKCFLGICCRFVGICRYKRLEIKESLGINIVSDSYQSFIHWIFWRYSFFFYRYGEGEWQ